MRLGSHGGVFANVPISTALLRDRQNTVRYNWGFRFALWCAILWGMSYLGLDIMTGQGLTAGVTPGSSTGLTASSSPYYTAIIIALTIAVFEAVVSTAWTSISGSFREWWQIIRRFDRVNLYFLLCAISSGSVAWLSFVTLSQIDATFAVAMVMFYPIIGTLIANRWYKEKVFKQCILGLAIIGAGCAVLYLPEAMKAANQNFLVISIIGILVGCGWGLESSIASRAMDVTSANLAASLRLTYEAVIWIIIAIVLSLVSPAEYPVLHSLSVLCSEPRALVFLAVAAIALSFNYYAWYQSSLLCG
ncbi:MAG: hypothetical protein LBU61_04810, partial [Coriobacteriales bacterium]|nr:hypothetical protein [Coriobacteriales bacterium]